MNFCTLFDANYLSRGLNMYYSLQRHCRSFHLYIFAFDDQAFHLLKHINLPGVTLISLSQLESTDSDLLQVKPTRSQGEYCWTSTPSTIKYVLETYELETCTYLDSDLYFFSDPSVLYEEMGDNSVFITPHRYTPQYDKSQTSGIYCVQYVTFRHDERGMEVLNWWRDACLEWCYNRHEDGKFGDQKYLDDWPTRFEGVHVLNHLGGGVAPWNIQQYIFFRKNGQLFGRETSTDSKFNLIFYHFHFVTFYISGMVDLSPYKLSSADKRLIYLPYLEEIEQTKRTLMRIDHTLNPHGSVQKDPGLWSSYYSIKRKILGIYNVHSLSLMLN